MRHKAEPEPREIVEGEAAGLRYRLVVNGDWEAGGFATLEEAAVEISRRSNRLAKRYQIADGRTIIPRFASDRQTGEAAPNHGKGAGQLLEVVEGAAAKSHLGKRARGGKPPSS
jgi:hypothetical protein